MPRQSRRRQKNQLQVFVGSPQLTETAKAILGAFGGVTGIAGALLALQHKLGHKLGQKRGFQWLLVVVAVVFFVLLSIVISWVLVLIRSRSWMQSAVNWVYHESALSSLSLPAWRVELFVAFFFTAVLLFFGIVMGRFHRYEQFFPSRHISQPVDPRIPSRFTHQGHA